LIESLLFVTGLLVFLDLIFTAMRVSLGHARLPQLITVREKNPQDVDRTINLLEKPSLAASMRLAVALMHFLLALTVFRLLWFGNGSRLPEPWLSVFVMVGVVLVVLMLEYAVEGAILDNVEGWAVRLTWLAWLIDILLRPATWLLLAFSGQRSAEHKSLSSVTEDELKNWVEDEHPENTLEKDERRMIYSIFQFGDTLAREIMVPRIDVFALDASTSLTEAIQAMLLSGHSRLPVYEDSIDNVIGLLYAKDLLRLQIESEQPKTLVDLLRPAYFVPEAKKVDELLGEMQARGVHMSIVVDEYGGMAGLVTLEDIVEEIVGEIRDEYDQSEELPYEQISPDEYLFLGRIDLDDFNEVLGTHLTKDVADTLGGFIYGEIGRVPVGNEKVTVDGWQLTVEQVIGRRIRLVRAVRIPLTGEVEEKEDETER
jgi:putative hemolysin